MNGESWNEVFRIKGLSDGLSINKIGFLTEQQVVAIGNWALLRLVMIAGVIEN